MIAPVLPVLVRSMAVVKLLCPRLAPWPSAMSPERYAIVLPTASPR